jgi:hypothetical protein
MWRVFENFQCLLHNIQCGRLEDTERKQQGLSLFVEWKEEKKMDKETERN